MNFKARAWTVGLLTATIAVVTVVVVSAQKDQRQSPLPAYYFEVEIAGVTYPFRSCSGLRIETDVVEYQEGGNTGTIRKLPGPTRYANIRLTRAFTGDRFLYDWLKHYPRNPIRVDGRITMFDSHGTEIATWKFVNGFPVKWEGPSFDANKNEVAIESLEIAHEGLTLDDDDHNPPPPPPSPPPPPK